eukprot:SAG31_NODE_6355_length_2047_cov_1.557495_1_plen_119_part_00
MYAQRAEVDPRTAALLQQDWDYIVLQSYSALPTVRKAREKYLYPAVASFGAKKKSAKIVMYLTWGYQCVVCCCLCVSTPRWREVYAAPRAVMETQRHAHLLTMQSERRMANSPVIIYI